MFLQAVATTNKEQSGTDLTDGRVSNSAALSYLFFISGIVVIGVFFLRNYYT
jgi:hypothetical protein